MTYARLLSLLFGLSGFWVFGVGAYQTFADQVVVELPVALLGSAYCLLVAWLVRAGRGLVRHTFSIAASGIWLCYVLRFMLFQSGADFYRFEFVRLVQVDDQLVASALGFMLAGTIAFYLGLAVACGGAKGSVQAVSRAIYPQRQLVLIIGLVVLMVYAGLMFAGGVVEVSSGGAPAYAFLLNLLPVTLLLHAVVFLLVAYRGRLSGAERGAAWAFLFTYMAILFAAGTRSAVFQPLVAFSLVSVLVHGDRLISRKSIVRAGVLVGVLLLVLPYYIGVTMYLRDRVRLSVDSAIIFRGMGAGLQMISERFPGFDILLAVIGHQPRDLAGYMTLAGIGKSMLAFALPDRVLGSAQPALGQLFAVYYQGHPWDSPHYGAWLGFGVTYALAGAALGLLLIGVYAYLVGIALRVSLRGSVTSGWLAAYLLHALVLMFFISGNLDGLVAGVVVQGAIFGASVWLARGIQMRTKSLVARPSAVPSREVLAYGRRGVHR